MRIENKTQYHSATEYIDLGWVRQDQKLTFTPLFGRPGRCLFGVFPGFCPGLLGVYLVFAGCPLGVRLVFAGWLGCGGGGLVRVGWWGHYAVGGGGLRSGQRGAGRVGTDGAGADVTRGSASGWC